MSLNATMIEWCQFTWNPVVGCKRLCKQPNNQIIFCYAYYQAKRQKNRCNDCYTFTPHLHSERLEAPIHRIKPSVIFVCSMADLFGPWVPDEWIVKVLEIVEKTPDHVYMFLTKYPKRYSEFNFPWNCYLGTSVSSEADYERAIELEISTLENISYLSAEPIHGPICLSMLGNADLLIVGAETGRKPTPYKKEWIQEIIDWREQTASFDLFLKNNLNWPVEWRELPSDEWEAFANLEERNLKLTSKA